jgi:hypothetical protein
VGFSEGGVGEEVAVTSGGVGEGAAVTSLRVGVDVISGVDVELGSPGVPLDVGPGTGVDEGVGLDSGEGEGVVVGESPGSVVGRGVSLAAEAVEVSTLVAPGLGEGEASSSAGTPDGVELGGSTEREIPAGAAAARNRPAASPTECESAPMQSEMSRPAPARKPARRLGGEACTPIAPPEGG